MATHLIAMPEGDRGAWQRLAADHGWTAIALAQALAPPDWPRVVLTRPDASELREIRAAIASCGARATLVDEGLLDTMKDTRIRAREVTFGSSGDLVVVDEASRETLSLELASVRLLVKGVAATPGAPTRHPKLGHRGGDERAMADALAGNPAAATWSRKALDTFPPFLLIYGPDAPPVLVEETTRLPFAAGGHSQTLQFHRAVDEITRRLPDARTSRALEMKLFAARFSALCDRERSGADLGWLIEVDHPS